MFVTGTHVGTVYTFENGQWTLHQTDSAQVFSSLWGIAEDNLWAGTYDDEVDREPGVFHFDGDQWQGRPWGATNQCGDSHPTAKGIWGVDDTVYLHSDHELVRMRNGVSESLLQWDCNLLNTPNIRSIWGTGRNELFMVVSTSSDNAAFSCNDTVLLHFDGSEFHQF